ncbi:MAG: DUF4350 domain-containing protein [Thermoanaerobaculia bacterium]
MSRFSLSLWLAISLSLGAAAAQRIPDPEFDTSVERPAYKFRHPAVVIDEAHSNFHTAEGRYKPLAELLRSDGYRVTRGTRKFDWKNLKGARVLVISNATAPDATDEASGPAFTDEECNAVRDWVRAGGSLLLIADHTPYGSAAENLAKRFGVDMGKGTVFDPEHGHKEDPTVLTFSRENRLLGPHPLLRGRDPDEEVKLAVAFTGQSLGVPDGAVALLKLGPGAREAQSVQELQAATGRPVGGRAQGIALKLGKGRVVMMGEAAMFSAQLIRFEQEGKQVEFKMGMNVPGNDDRQLALNIFHWLSGLLE